MSNWHTEDNPKTTSGALLIGGLALVLGIIFIGVLVIRPISEAAADREQSRAYAIAAQSQAQIAAERERTERAAQEQQTARMSIERRAETTVYGIVLIGAILAFGVVITAAIGAAFALENLTGAAQERRHQHLLIYTAQIAALGGAAETLQLQPPAASRPPAIIIQ
jgi:Na+-transporting methylmalonyl-CoA/oxaloacetate decarboxylase gamma subunit